MVFQTEKRKKNCRIFCLLVLIMAAFQNVNYFVFERIIVSHKADIQNISNVNYFKTSLMYIFNAVKKQSGIGFVVDALFGNISYPRNLFIIVELFLLFNELKV